MKKTAILSLLLAMAMLLGLLAGCGGSAAAPADSASAPEASNQDASGEAAAAEPAQDAQPEPEGSDEIPAEPEEAEPVYEKVEVALPISEGGETISMYLLLPPFITAMVASPTPATPIPMPTMRMREVFCRTARMMSGETGTLAPEPASR